jgi:hypothetical protein
MCFIFTPFYRARKGNTEIFPFSFLCADRILSQHEADPVFLCFVPKDEQVPCQAVVGVD